MKYIYFYETDIGRIGIAEENEENKIINVYLNTDVIPENFEIKETELLKEAGIQLNNYLSGKQKSFSLPLAPSGTEFMKAVWQSLRNIPYGETVSYKTVAKNIGNEKACRAVGLANNKNPIPIFIPCHRVIGANGKMVGYRGGLEVKKYLLELEKKYSNI
jgi:methylated-DNA-[protein]-cysteine S-methyltransferase